MMMSRDELERRYAEVCDWWDTERDNSRKFSGCLLFIVTNDLLTDRGKALLSDLIGAEKRVEDIADEYGIFLNQAKTGRTDLRKANETYPTHGRLLNAKTKRCPPRVQPGERIPARACSHGRGSPSPVG